MEAKASDEAMDSFILGLNEMGIGEDLRWNKIGE